MHVKNTTEFGVFVYLGYKGSGEVFETSTGSQTQAC